MYVKIEEKSIQIKNCTKFIDRFIGFMFHFDKIETGLCFPNCKSIHTFFMFQKIDVVMTDKDDKILYLYPAFQSERVIFSKKKVYYVYELPLQSIQKLRVGEYLRVFDNKKETSK